MPSINKIKEGVIFILRLRQKPRRKPSLRRKPSQAVGQATAGNGFRKGDAAMGTPVPGLNPTLKRKRGKEVEVNSVVDLPLQNVLHPAKAKERVAEEKGGKTTEIEPPLGTAQGREAEPQSRLKSEAR